jgi:site-specific recombinase XerD
MLAGLLRELSIHCARHSMALHPLKKTRNLRQIQKQLGHASIPQANYTSGLISSVFFV